MAAFRNHEDTRLDFDGELTAILGPNGAGKTSVLEAVHVLCTGRSFRRTDADALLRNDRSAGLVSGVFEHDGRSDEVTIGYGDYPRRFMVNGVERSHARDAVGIGCCVVFSPDDLDLVKGGPSERRAFLDGALVLATPRMADVQAEWNRVLKQRNSLLRSLKGRPDANPAALETWTELAAEKGAALAHERCRLIERLEPEFRAAVDAISDADASLVYTSSWAPADAHVDPDQLQKRLGAALHDLRRQELERGVTLAGPHRDDIALNVEGREARTQASQGEQRTLALALRLAEQQVLENIRHDRPILLLDDVLSEFDPRRRASLLDRIVGAQTLVTIASDVSTVRDSGPPEIDLLPDASDVATVCIEAGTVVGVDEGGRD